jgi:alginate O-acetyltransferase complex protein AlgI
VSFASLNYLLLLTITIVVALAIPPGRGLRLWLLLCSLVYFAASGVRDTMIFVAVAMVGYASALLIHRYRSKALLAVLLAILMLPLLVTKYFDFFAANLAITVSPELKQFFAVGLPIGISFYTFQKIAYIVDVYRQDVKPERSFTRYSLFTAYFPQLIAGPIERAAHLLPQLYDVEKNGFAKRRVAYGLALIGMGLFLKGVIADNLATIVDLVYRRPGDHPDSDVLLAVYYFSLQIYGDFYGYTLIALGSAQLMGIDLINNFQHPYLAANIRDFWRRWHISLTNWFRDYVYIPLGGNRVSRLRNAANLMLILLLVGLWHGASWMFVIWGFLHGLALAAHRLYISLFPSGVLRLNGWQRQVATVFSVIVTFHFVTFAWIFFRSSDLQTAELMVRKASSALLSGSFGPSTYHTQGFYQGIFLLGIAFLLLDRFLRPAEWFERQVTWRRVAVASALLPLFYISSPDAIQFIYFRF